MPTHHSRLVAAIGIAAACLDQRLDSRTVEIGAHHAHPFAIAPVELAVRLIELDLLRRVRATGGMMTVRLLPSRSARSIEPSFTAGLEPMLVQ